MRSTDFNGLNEAQCIEWALVDWLKHDEGICSSDELFYYWNTFPWNNPYKFEYRGPAEWDHSMRYVISLED